ncbi:hypothetical protein HY992_01070 [Candidatus Micrarchaeota archaeon]|nr:hypothetical protein [Candidatus Micrarchaeota archaeon]
METDAQQRIDALEKRKFELISKAKELDSRLNYKNYEAKALKEILSRENTDEYRRLKRTLNEIEFRIATESTNLQAERKMMKEIRDIQAKLEKAGEIERKRRKLFLVEGDVRQLTDERNLLEKEIQQLKAEAKSYRDELNEKDAEAREATRRERKRKELEEKRVKMMEDLGINDKPIEGEVSLGEIAVIKKKGV